MSAKPYLLALFLLVGAVFTASAQFRPENYHDYQYNSELAAGINFNTNGGLIGGLTLKYARLIKPGWYHHFALEAVNVKHPKEQRLFSQATGRSFIPGKQNYLYTVRPMYGREKVLFKKAREQGIQVNAIAAVGPAIGVVAPYLIEYRFSNGVLRTEQYNPEVHINFQNILGTGGFTESLAASELNIGASIKAALSFEFGVIKTNVTGFEAGVVMDLYPNEIPIIPMAENRSSFTSVYLTFFFGSRR